MELHLLSKSQWRRFEFDGDALREITPPATFRKAGPAELGEADGLVFSRSGDGPSFDLQVTGPGGERLIVTDTHLTRTNFCHLPSLDAVMMVDGDPGTSTSRAFPVIGLADIRERLAQGGGTCDIRELNHFRLQAAVNLIDPESPNLTFRPVEGSPEIVIYWNTPMANPPVAGICVVEWYRYKVGDALRPATRRVSKPIDLENFWVHEVLAGRRPNGDLLLSAIGIGRKRRDFLLELRVLAAEAGTESLREVMRGSPAIHRPTQVSLRHNASILALAPVSDGMIGVFETPTRSTRLLHIPFDQKKFDVRELDKPCPIQAIVSFAQAPPAPTLEVEPDEEEAAPGLHHVGPEGAALDAGVFPADGEITARVYIVGDGAGADLRHWLSQTPGAGDVAYTLHVTAARAVQIRFAVDHFE
jgi:hypothetical protein